MITSFRTHTLTVTRPKPFTIVNGYPVQGEWITEQIDIDGNVIILDPPHFEASASTTFTIKASVQPVSGKDLVFMPEGMSVNDVNVIFSDTQLNTANEAAKTLPDEVEIDGRVFVVFHVEKWANKVINHFRYLVKLK